MEDLNSLREQIDQVDNRLLDLIAERLILVKKVGDIKKKLGRKVRDPKREQERLENLAFRAASQGISKDIVTKVWRTFFKIAYKVEE